MLLVLLILIFLAATLFLGFGLLTKKWKSRRKYLVMAGIVLFVFGSRFFVFVYPGAQGIPEGNREDQINEVSADNHWLENTGTAMIHTFQTFSMDEDYDGIMVAEKAILKDAPKPLADLMIFQTSLFNLIAPMASMTVIITILSHLFPRAKIFFLFWRPKIIFSKLNPQSLVLGEDIASELNSASDKETPKLSSLFSEKKNWKHFWNRPMLIYTDAYIQSDIESDSEMLGRAKDIGALCVKNDMRQLPVSHSSKVIYVLLDENPKSRIESLDGLTRSTSYPPGKTYVYIFVDDPLWESYIDNIVQVIKSEDHQRLEIRIVKDYMTLTTGLVQNIPLFYPLTRRSDKNEPLRKLKVGIAGSGLIAREMLKTFYWVGQMASAELEIVLLGKDSYVIKDDLRKGYPELLASCEENNDVLRSSPLNQPVPSYNRPYARLRFVTVEDVNRDCQVLLTNLQDCDYLVTALGKDEDNARLAVDLQSVLTRHNLESREDAWQVIVPIIFDDGMKAALMPQSDHQGDSHQPLIIPYGLIRERFTVKAMRNTEIAEFSKQNDLLYGEMEELLHRAAGVFEKPNKPEPQKKPESLLQRLTKFVQPAQESKAESDQKQLDKNYLDWANWAKTIHAPYKLFDIGLIKNCEYAQGGIRISQTGLYREDSQKIIKDWDKIDQLCWCEQRRWNAFQRSQGFSAMNTEDIPTIGKGGQKNISLKLHACLVESQDKIALPALLRKNLNEQEDRLDEVSREILKQVKGTKGKILSEKYSGYYKFFNLPQADAALSGWLFHDSQKWFSLSKASLSETFEEGKPQQ